MEREKRSGVGDDSSSPYNKNVLDVKHHGAANSNVKKTRTGRKSPPHGKTENDDTSAHLSLDGDDSLDKKSRRSDDNAQDDNIHDEEMG